MEPNNKKSFTTPDFYFKKLEESILNKTIYKDKSNTVWGTPGNYFDQLENSILAKTVNSSTIEEKKRVNTPILHLFNNKVFKLSVAACLIIGGIAFLFMFNKNTESRNIATVITERENTVKVDPKENNSIDVQPIPNLDTTKHTVAQNNIDSNINKEEPSIASAKPNQKIKNKATTVSLNNQTNKNSKELVHSSEVIYNLYFDNELTNEYEQMEDEFYYF